MIKKIMYCIVAMSMFSCGGSKIRTQKSNTTKSQVSKKVTSNTTPTKLPNAKISEGEVLVATSKVKATTEDVKKYIEDFKEIAKSNMRQHGIPASIIMAQGILESGAGFGRLCTEANNHFGIKCHTDWTGETVTHDDDAVGECFRKYIHPSESYRDHALFLTKRKRYESLFKLDKGDYYAWANGLKQAGYATDTLYPTKLVGIIERYELYKLDNEVLGRNYVPKPKAEIITLDGEYTVQKGDTLYSLSRKFNISVDELKKINNMVDTAISIGQKLKIK